MFSSIDSEHVLPRCVQDVFWNLSISIYVLCPGGNRFQVKKNITDITAEKKKKLMLPFRHFGIVAETLTKNELLHSYFSAFFLLFMKAYSKEHLLMATSVDWNNSKRNHISDQEASFILHTLKTLS